MSTLPELEVELLHAARRASAARPSRRRTTIATVIAALLLAGGATATAQMGHPLWSLGTPIAPVRGPAVVDAVDVGQQGLDVLRQPSTAATALPPHLRASLSARTLAGENPDLGRKALTAFGDTFWVVPGAGGKICLFVNGGGGGCGPASHIDQGTFSGLMPCAQGGVVYYGMLPNGADDVSLTLAGGATRGVAVTNNVWAVQIARQEPQPKSLRWTQGAQRKQASIGALAPPAPGSAGSC